MIITLSSWSSLYYHHCHTYDEKLNFDMERCMLASFMRYVWWLYSKLKIKSSDSDNNNDNDSDLLMHLCTNHFNESSDWLVVIISVILLPFKFYLFVPALYFIVLVNQLSKQLNNFIYEIFRIFEKHFIFFSMRLHFSSVKMNVFLSKIFWAFWGVFFYYIIQLL